eukprot:Hpha_TRINITY_DN19983_c0_g1::TRINITY_DN19983_c0_g1_i1::g.93483::m.93483
MDEGRLSPRLDEVTSEVAGGASPPRIRKSFSVRSPPPNTSLGALYAKLSPARSSICSPPPRRTPDGLRASTRASSAGLVPAKTSRPAPLLSGRVSASPLSRFGQWAGVRDPRDDDENEYLRRLLEDDDSGSRYPRSIFSSHNYDFWDFEREMRRREQAEKRKVEREAQRNPELGRGTAGLVRVTGGCSHFEEKEYAAKVLGEWSSSKTGVFHELDETRHLTQKRLNELVQLDAGGLRKLRIREAKQMVKQRKDADQARLRSKLEALEREEERARRDAKLERDQRNLSDEIIKAELREADRQRILASQNARQALKEWNEQRRAEREAERKDRVYERHLRTRSEKYQMAREKAIDESERKQRQRMFRAQREDERLRAQERIAAEAERRAADAKEARMRLLSDVKQRKAERDSRLHALQQEMNVERTKARELRFKHAEESAEKKVTAAQENREQRKEVVKEALRKRDCEIKARCDLVEEVKRNRSPSPQRPPTAPDRYAGLDSPTSLERPTSPLGALKPPGLGTAATSPNPEGDRKSVPALVDRKSVAALSERKSVALVKSPTQG